MRLQRWAAAGALLCASLSLLMPACEAKDDERSEEQSKMSSGAALSVQMTGETDVSGFSILVTRVSCNGEPFTSYSKTYESATLDLDISVKVTADGSSHTFADTFIPLETGCYDIVSIPKKADGTPSGDCAIAGQNGVIVFDGQPTEVVLVSQCNGQVKVGAKDVISLLNRPPQLNDLTYPGGKFVAHCDDQQLCATFKDPDGDPLEVMWTKVLGLPGSTFVVGLPAPQPDGSVKQCITVDHAGPGMMLIEATAYDLLKNPNEPGLIRFEQLYADQGIPATSHDSFLFQAYGASSDTCPCAPNPEVCDGVDNDCDGQNDDGLASCVCTPLVQAPCYGGPAGTLGVGECNGGIQVCAPDGSSFGPCVGQVTPGAEECQDGKDNDCDSVVDNDCCVLSAGQPCVVPGGLGACAEGYIECDGTCTPPDVLWPETCNGIDDDCNGVVDDNLPPAAGLCFAGVGACQATGILTCQGGAIVCDAVPLPAFSQEICNNGIDDDCNGVTDDCAPCDPTMGAPCSVAGAKGACAPGHVTCQGACAPDSAPQAEVCNGVDDDCDGQTDEGLSGGACSAGLGACQATGQQVCMGGSFVCNATPGQPIAEVCGNSLDEDCDGVADDGCAGCVPNEGQACVVPNQAGACAAGLVQCNGTCQSVVQPSAEVCDGADNDCDGPIDEGLTSGTCQTGTGACFAAGTFVCSGGTFVCNVAPGVPQPEIPCNGIDEDCNGADACPQCVPQTEVCDGADNDCDGLVDESLAGGPCTAGIGACAANGQQVCAAGTFVCNAVPGQPSAEVCGNGVDEDCNGVAEMCGGGCVPNAGQACSVPGKLGPCSAGLMDCFGDCQSVVQPSAEVCNAVDDDCDGQVDEGLAGGACTAGTGACQSAGQLVCSAGGFVCNAVPGQPQPEIQCNGIDEDCDGQDACLPSPCGNGACDAGETYCTCPNDCALPDYCSNPGVVAQPGYGYYVVQDWCSGPLNPWITACDLSYCTNHGDGTFTNTFDASIDWLGGCYPGYPASTCTTTISICPP